MAKSIGLRIKVIKALKRGRNIVEVAGECKVSVWTIRRWLKRYQEGGLKRLTQPRPYIPPWNITPEEIAEKIYLLKENNPKITLSQTRKQLLSMGVQISLKCIQKIWRRYGFSGYDKNEQIAALIPKISFSQDIIIAINNANKILEQNGDVKEAAKILNQLPYCGGAEVLDKIPYKYLGLRRRVEKVPFLFGEEPLHKFYRRVRNLRLALEKNNLFYSSLRAGVLEANALAWLGKPRQMLSLISLLEKRLPRYIDPMVCFNLILLKGTALSRLLRLNEAALCAKECKRLTKTLNVPNFHIGLGNLYSNIGMYSQAKNCYEKAIQNASETIREQGLIFLAGCRALNGEYQRTLKILKKIEQKKSPFYTSIPLVYAQSLFGLGLLIESAQYAKTAIEIAKKNEILQYLHTSTMVLATIYYALGEKERAKSLLQNTTPLLKKMQMMQDYYIRRLLLTGSKVSTPEIYTQEPFIKLILLMQKANQTKRLKDYNQALRFATRRGLRGFFHRLCIFNSGLILKFMERGKPTGLPKTIIGLPIFNKNLPAFHISFFGSIKIYRTGILSKVKLRPKDAAFLIHLSLSKRLRLSSDDACKNFWPRSKDAKGNLFHLLWRLRKTLGIPSHNFYIKSRYIYLKGFLTTDLQKFKETLAIARAFERNGRWGFARREYKKAFSLFHGEPFKKMYDNWSENMRRVILNRLETEAINFAKSCLEHRNKRDAKKVLEKVLKIIPNSEEPQKLLETL